MRLLASTLLLMSGAALASDVTIDVNRDRRPISELIYGISAGSDAQAARMGVTIRRFGGNGWSRYNYLASTTNEGGEYAGATSQHFFKNLVFDGGAAGDYADWFIGSALSSGSQVMVEVPSLGFVSKPMSASSAPFDCGFRVSRYGIQEATDPADPDCGNGRNTIDGGFLMGVSPADTSVPIDAGFIAGWLSHLTQRFGSGGDGGVHFYALGNQPALSSVTHADVHPDKSSYAEMGASLANLSAVVKQSDPSAKTIGPSEWGWINYFDSAAGDRLDAGIDFVPFYLQKARALALQRGSRQLDYLDLHVYPQADFPNTDAITNGDVSAAAAALRLRSTSILWDPTYLPESWERCCFYTPGVGQQIIVRMRDWVSQSYPGTALAISSYDWGAPNHPSGALAQTEVLGIFGREGIDLAMHEGPTADFSLLENAFRLYRNFDGQGSTFGGLSVFSHSSGALVSSYAAYDLDGRVTVILINKDPVNLDAALLTFTGVAGGSWRAFGFAGSSALASNGVGTLVGSQLVRSLPPYSAEIIELIPSGFIDAGVPDAGPPDAGLPDAGVPDAGIPDAGVPDAGGPDAGAPDAGAPDAGPMQSDASVPDAGRDAGLADAGTTTDAGNGPAGQGGCGCSSGAGIWPLLGLLSLAFRRARRIAGQ